MNFFMSNKNDARLMTDDFSSKWCLSFGQMERAVEGTDPYEISSSIAKKKRIAEALRKNN